MTRHEPEGGAQGVSEWFPAKERGRVVGIHTAGASPARSLRRGRSPSWCRILAGASFSCSQGPTEEERIIAGGDAGGSDAMPAEGRCRHILSRRETWLLIAGRMITDPVWYFYLFWFPKYLTDVPPAAAASW